MYNMEEQIRERVLKLLHTLWLHTSYLPSAVGIFKDITHEPYILPHLSDHADRIQRMHYEISKGSELRVEEIPPVGVLHFTEEAGIGMENTGETIKFIVGGKYGRESPRVHKRGGSIVIGRVGHYAGYHALDEFDRPEGFRPLARVGDRGVKPDHISRVHGIILPHPEEDKRREGWLVYVHLGTNPYKIEGKGRGVFRETRTVRRV